MDVRVLISASIRTDHNLVQRKIKTEKPEKTQKSPVYIEKYNLEVIKHESTRQLYENRLTQKMLNA